MLKIVLLSQPMLTLREALINLLPSIIILNVIMLLRILLETFGGEQFAALTYALVNFELLINLGLPLIAMICASMVLAKYLELDRVVTSVVSIAGFAILNVSALQVNNGQLQFLQSSILAGFFAAYFSCYLYAYFCEHVSLKQVLATPQLNPALKNALNRIAPSIAVYLCCLALRLLTDHLLQSPFTALLEVLHSQVVGLWPEVFVYSLLSQFFYFLGFHGPIIASGVANALGYFQQQQEIGKLLSLFYVYVNIGGAGATIGLLIATLIRDPSPQHRAIARLALPFSVFNINEILVFGLPVVLNPVLLIPFILAPIVNLVIVAVAQAINIIVPLTTVDAWYMPMIINAYHLSNGSLAAVGVQVLCIAVSAMIYWPFVGRMARRYESGARLHSLGKQDALILVKDAEERRAEPQFMARQYDGLNFMRSARKQSKLLEGGEFILYFQPKVSLRTRAVIGIEALLRLRDKNGVMHSPSFLPTLHRFGLGASIDDKVVALVMAQIETWKESGFTPPLVSINLDRLFLLDQQRTTFLLDEAKRLGVVLQIEVTEQSYTANLDALREVVNRIRKQGHSIAVDDFGTGFSSLASLLSMEIDEIKFDRGMAVPPLGEYERGMVLLKYSVNVCHELGFSVVAEGVETPAQVDFVRSAGIDVVQGNFFAAPMTAANLSIWLGNRNN